MNPLSILVTGATGKAGSRIAKRLEAQGHAVRRASRNAIIPFDWENPATWVPALDGQSVVYVCLQPDFAFPGALETLVSFAQIARRVGVSRAVMINGRGEPAAERGEEVIRATGLTTTVLRSAWFAQNFSEGSLRDAVLAGTVPMPGGDIREPIIDLDDLADVAVAALTDKAHAGLTYELTGPRLLGFAEVAELLARAAGLPVRYLPITFEEFRSELERTAGTVFADIVTEIARETFDGRNARVTDDVKHVLGRAPRDFNQFATDAARAGAWRIAA
ncbi:NAD(P)H-binding protein [Oricola sp.]|uniref:NAD(P)H-binding protein n=1 Tax=Oricola sp. TaxID=1979950 RepID=UPI003BAA6ECE